MGTREFRGLELAARAAIEQRGNRWYVPSSSKDGGYFVDYEATWCSCEDFELRQMPCKHVFAVRFVKERNRGKPLPVQEVSETTAEPTLPPTKKPTYRQDWANYNGAQTNEKRLFQELLADLCDTIANPPQETGRRRIPRCDAVFAAVFKVYSTLSGRRFTCDLQAAEAAGYVAKAPHYNSVFRVLEDAEITGVLKRLIIQSSAPLRQVETQFAVDSSGFSTSRFLRWFDQKYGVQKKKAVWIKCHLMCGTQTNIVTAVHISDSGDCPMLPSLTATTAQNFPVREVSADKAYLSQKNMEFVDGLGGVPYIPFKSNSRGDTRPGIWERMHAEFILNREEWLTHYHRRSNVESTFAMIKGKFGDAVRSKSEVAMNNEVLAKVLCHNLCCLIHAMYELGIDPKLAEPGAEPTILKFTAGGTGIA